MFRAREELGRLMPNARIIVMTSAYDIYSIIASIKCCSLHSAQGIVGVHDFIESSIR